MSEGRKPYSEMSNEELEALERKLKAEYKKIQGLGLELNMSRGKPCVEQLDLSMGMMDVLSSDSDLRCEDGTDCRNYDRHPGGDGADGRYDGGPVRSSDHLWEFIPECHV